MEKQRCVKMDDIMKNMLIHSLRMVFREEKEKGLSTDVTRDFVLKLAYYEQPRLFLTDVEHKKAIEALNMLRNSFIAAGRYTDGIDTIFLKILQAKYKRCKVR
ncbi:MULTISPECIES: hypothetical protein [Clostridia]|uniref:hypothetical protein n=1 Tax=Clostridia TaxID=186801 RepID=UPI00067F166B|nr:MULTISPECIES: hypothetical protein [Clostridia]